MKYDNVFNLMLLIECVPVPQGADDLSNSINAL